jgi:flagellar protein FlaG
MTIIADYSAAAPRPVRSAPAAAAPAPAPAAPSPLEVKVEVARAVEAVSRMLAPLARGLEFSVDAETGDTVVRVVDSESGEVVRQIPSPEMIAIARALTRVQGLLLDAKA